MIRTTGVNKDEELIAEISYNGTGSYEFFDNIYGITPEDAYYSVNCVYIRGDEQCESEYMDLLIHFTDVSENAQDIRLFPNPTTGILKVECLGEVRVSVSNLLGQEILNTVINGPSTIDLGGCKSGLYMVRLETRNTVTVRKVTVE